jgi:hypothetical protein
MDLQSVYSKFLNKIVEQSKLTTLYCVIPKEQLLKLKKSGLLIEDNVILFKSKDAAKHEIKTNLKWSFIKTKHYTILEVDVPDRWLKKINETFTSKHPIPYQYIQRAFKIEKPKQHIICELYKEFEKPIYIIDMKHNRNYDVSYISYNTRAISINENITSLSLQKVIITINNKTFDNIREVRSFVSDLTSLGYKITFMEKF